MPSTSNPTSTNTLPASESHSLVVKVYETVLSNPTVQSGIKQVKTLSHPYIVKYEDRFYQLSADVKRWVSQENIYNQLANLWLSINLPLSGAVASFEKFEKFVEKAKFALKTQNEEVLKAFHQYATEAWGRLNNEPTVENVKTAILEIVAKTIAKAHNIKDEVVATTLFQMVVTLVEKRREFISKEAFLNLVQTKLGADFLEKHSAAVKAAATEYYNFAKKFLLVDFPLATRNNDVFRLIVDFVQNNSLYYSHSTLDLIESRLNSVLALLGQSQEETAPEVNTLSQKAQRVLSKAVLILTLAPPRVTDEVTTRIMANKTYIALDTRYGITQKVIDAKLSTVFFTQNNYKRLRLSVIEPSYDTVKALTNKAKDQVTVVMQGLNVELLKKRYTKLHTEYEILQKCAVIVAGETVKLVFDKQALAELGEHGKKEITRLYAELKSLEKEKIKNVGLEYYATVLKKAQTTYNTASERVTQEKQEAIRN